jgi:thioredoxin
MFRRRKRTTDAAVSDAASGPHDHAEIAEVTDTNFREVTAGRPTVVDMWAPWCGPCRAFAPLFHRAAARWGASVRFGSCNVDENPRTAALLQVHSIPTLVGFSPRGDEVGRLVGIPSAARLEHFLAELAAMADGQRVG